MVTLYCELYTIYCKIRNKTLCTIYHSIALTVNYKQYDTIQYHSVHCIVYSVNWIVYSVHCILYSVNCIVYSVHCIVYSVNCILYSVNCIVYSVNCILYSVHCIVFSVNCTVEMCKQPKS